MNTNDQFMPLLKLTPAEQFDIAFKLAENIGYILAREPEHPDSPHNRDVHDYVQNYEFRFDGGAAHVPNDRDKSMLEDAIEGYLAMQTGD